MASSEVDRPTLTEEQVRHEPWHAVWSEDGTWPGQAERHRDLRRRIGATIGDRVYLAPGAAIVCESLAIGDRSYVAAGCLLRDRITLGRDCSVNPHVTMAGRVDIGDDVRIASHAAFFGFNHVFDDVDVPIWWQGLTEVGITVEDDVWVGAHVVVCDGVTVGSHSVLAAGAVVTRDVPPFSVMAGVPAKAIRDRRVARPEAGGSGVRDPLGRFAARVSEQWPDVIDRCRASVDGDATFVDSPGAPLTRRATCDALEIAAAFDGLDQVGPRRAMVQRLQGWQDPGTGLFPDPAETMPDDPLQWQLGDEYHHYGVLSVGYALEVLGAAPSAPVRVVEVLSNERLLDYLDGLPWRTLAWPAGSWVDFLGTATYLNRRHHGSTKGLETLFGWLLTRFDTRSGVWGPPDDHSGWLLPVNGFYRLTRGTYAQFGQPLPAPEAAIDTVLAHCRDYRWFAARHRTACNVLDVVHPLWLCAAQTDHRRSEITDQLAALLGRTLSHWVDGEGFAFKDGRATGLQGTEMWLSIIHLLAAYLNESEGLPWQPRGVHRLDPAATLTQDLKDRPQ